MLTAVVHFIQQYYILEETVKNFLARPVELSVTHVVTQVFKSILKLSIFSSVK